MSLQDDARWYAGHLEKVPAASTANAIALLKSCADELDRLTTELAAVTAERDALLNAEWLTTAHMICTDAGIEQGHIADRMKQLRDKWDALRRDAELGRLATTFVDRAGDHCPADPAEKICNEFNAAMVAATGSNHVD